MKRHHILKYLNFLVEHASHQLSPEERLHLAALIESLSSNSNPAMPRALENQRLLPSYIQRCISEHL